MSTTSAADLAMSFVIGDVGGDDDVAAAVVVVVISGVNIGLEFLLEEEHVGVDCVCAGMCTPTSACLSAMASFVPSPMKRTTLPWCCSVWM